MNVLDALAQFSTLPLALSTNYGVLAAIQLDAVRGPKWVSALERALTSPQHRVIDAPPSDVDFAGLAANHLTTQVGEQMTLSSDLFAAMTGHYVDDPVLLSGAQSPQSLLALDRSGFHDVVLPEKDLSEAPSSTLNWGSPFHITAPANSPHSVRRTAFRARPRHLHRTGPTCRVSARDPRIFALRGALRPKHALNRHGAARERDLGHFCR